MTTRTRTLLAALMGTLALTASAASLADSGRWDRRGNGDDHGRWEHRGQGWGHQKHERWQHQHRYQPANGYIVIQSTPRLIYAPPAYYDDGYSYRAPGRYVYPVAPSFSFGMTIPLD